MTSALAPLRYDPPLRDPAPGGLLNAVEWVGVDSGSPSRHLTGAEIRAVGNFGGAGSSGVWGAPWCAVPGLTSPTKSGTRPDGLDSFEPVTVWAYDQCDLTEPSRAEVEQRAAQTLRLRESAMVARQFADRLLVDAGTPTVVHDVVNAFSVLEGAFADATAVGFIHASPTWLPFLVAAHLVTQTGIAWTTPAGHVLVLDGGYRLGLGTAMVATSSPLFGWRDDSTTRTAVDVDRNVFAAIAERTVLVGYEALIGAVTVTP